MTVFSTFKVIPTANGRKLVKIYPYAHNSHEWAYLEYLLSAYEWMPDLEHGANIPALHRGAFDGHDTEYLVWYFKREHGNG